MSANVLCGAMRTVKVCFKVGNVRESSSGLYGGVFLCRIVLVV